MKNRVPSVKTLMARLRLSEQMAVMLRCAMQCKRGLRFYNVLSGGFGVETIGLPDGCFDNCRQPELTIKYVNHGDTYDTTLLWVGGRYRVGSWGDIVEAYDRRRIVG
jgi:hypothetical protein